MRAARLLRAAPLLAALLVLAGCASVPGHSSVQVLRQTGDPAASATPAGPVDGSDPLNLVRGFVYASGRPADRHGAARRYLAPQASAWDDGAALTILDEQFDTVFSPAPPVGLGPDRASVRIRGTRLGTLDPSGAFRSAPAPVEVDVGVARRGGQWRIDGPPPGVFVRLSDFRANFRSLKAWYVDPVHRTLLSDPRYVPSGRTTELAARAVELLLRGPSEDLRDAAVTSFPRGASLRANLSETADGVVVADFNGVDALTEPARRLLAGQLALTLAEVNVPRVRVLSDGEPLLPGHPDVSRDDFADLVAGPPPSQAPDPLVVDGGKVRALTGPGQDAPVGGQAGNGSFDVVDAAASSRTNRIAVVSREQAGTQRLLVGPRDGQLVATPVSGATLASPTWNAAGDEIWVLADGVPQRVSVPGAGSGVAGPIRILGLDVSELRAAGPLGDLSLSPDGSRVAAVAGGHAVVGAVVIGPDGRAAVRRVRAVRPVELGRALALDWRATDQLVVTTNTDTPIQLVSVDGLTLDPLSSVNLTPPLRAVAAAPGRAPYLVADRTGVWSYAGGDLDAWQQMLGATSSAQPFYPG